jgi:hypothetical protein
MLHERCLHLPRLDAYAADLYLLVQASEKLEVAVWAVAYEVACPIEASWV